MKTIRIANPRPGTAKFTSERAARKYVERKRIARWTDESRNEIFFFEASRFTEQAKQTVVEVKSAARRLGKVVFWNGRDADPYALHVPGQVRS